MQIVFTYIEISQVFFFCYESPFQNKCDHISTHGYDWLLISKLALHLLSIQFKAIITYRIILVLSHHGTPVENYNDVVARDEMNEETLGASYFMEKKQKRYHFRSNSVLKVKSNVQCRSLTRSRNMERIELEHLRVKFSERND